MIQFLYSGLDLHKEVESLLMQQMKSKETRGRWKVSTANSSTKIGGVSKRDVIGNWGICSRKRRSGKKLTGRG